MPQPHGGAIKRGGVNPGSGRPPNLIRDSWRGLLDAKGTGFLEKVLSGVVPMVEECPKCGHKPRKKIRLEASIDHGLNAVSTLARFGIGTRDELNVISPEVRMRVQATIALISSRSEWDTEELLRELDKIWS